MSQLFLRIRWFIWQWICGLPYLWGGNPKRMEWTTSTGARAVSLPHKRCGKPYLGFLRVVGTEVHWLSEPPSFEKYNQFVLKFYDEDGVRRILWSNDGRQFGDATHPPDSKTGVSVTWREGMAIENPDYERSGQISRDTGHA